jgi:hypothetical protein
MGFQLLSIRNLTLLVRTRFHRDTSVRNIYQFGRIQRPKYSALFEHGHEVRGALQAGK